MRAALRYWLTGVVVLFFAVACCQFLIFSDKAVINNSVSVWFDKKDSELTSYEHYNNTFGDTEWSSILLKTRSIYDPRFLKQLLSLTHDLEHMSEVFRVVSIANAEESINHDGELSYERLLSDRQIERGLSALDIQQLQKRLFSNPLFSGLLFKREDPQHTVILVKNGNYPDRQDDYRIRLEESIATTLGKYSTIESYSIVGTTILNANLNRTSLRDVYIYYSAIAGMLLLLGFAIFRSIKDVVIMVATVASTLVVSMGGLAVLSIPYNMVTVMLPTCVVAISTSTVIHVIDTFNNFAVDEGPLKARLKTVKHLLRPTLLTNGTTVLAFISLCFSSVLPIVQLGAFVSLGLIYAWLVSIFVVPCILEKLYVHSVRTGKIGERQFQRLIIFFTPPRLLLLLCLICLTFTGFKNLRIDTDYSKFFGSSHPLSIAYNQFDRIGFGQNPIALTYTFSAEGGYERPDIAQEIALLEQRIMADTRVVSSLSVGRILQQAHDAYMMSVPGTARIAEMNGDTVAQTLLLVQSSGNKDLEDLYRSDAVQTILLTPYMSSRQLKTFMADIQKIAKETLTGDVQLAINGTTVLWANMDQAVSRTQLLSLTFMTLVIFASMLYLGCTLKVAIAATLINLIPLGVVFGVMGILGIPVNLATALIAGVLLGIMVDDTIHVVSSTHRLTGNGTTPAQAVKYTLATTGLTLFKTTLVLVGCFLTLATSNFIPTQNFGWLVGLGLIMAILFDLLYLPRLLVRLMPNVRQHHNVSNKQKRLNRP